MYIYKEMWLVISPFVALVEVLTIQIFTAQHNEQQCIQS